MKITKSDLQKIIKAEVKKVLKTRAAIEVTGFMANFKNPEFKKDSTFEEFLKDVQGNYDILVKKGTSEGIYYFIFLTRHGQSVDSAVKAYEVSAKRMEKVGGFDHQVALVTPNTILNNL
jgi:hypothetical protein